MSTLRDWAIAQHEELRVVETQRIYLRNPLPAGPGICAVCRSTADERFQLCYQCNTHRSEAGGRLADVVVPISYSIKNTQHAHNLIIYKASHPSATAHVNLSSLGVLYLAYHWDCLTTALGGPFTHVASVPSTRGRQGAHPLDKVITSRINLPHLQPTVNATYSADDREFHVDRFFLPPGAATGARVLLVDDTWTSGGRIQSLAHTIKTAGATAVAAVVLGRHVNPQYGPAKALIDRLRTAPWFDLKRCVLNESDH